MKIIHRHFRLLFIRGLILSLVVALAGILLASTDMGRWLEEEVGLIWLFKLRGPMPSPSQVAVISIDHISSQKLGLDTAPDKWPRSLHGKLVRKLTKHGASVIVFDIFFDEVRDVHDNDLFASALRQSGNTLLFQSFDKQAVLASEHNAINQHLAYIETLNKPVASLSDAAAGLAIFPLPKVPAQVNHFILFKPELGNLPSLPVAALQVYSMSVHQQLLELLNDIIPEQVSLLSSQQLLYQNEKPNNYKEIEKLSQHLRSLFLINPELASKLLFRLETTAVSITKHQRQILRRLINSYNQPHSLYLNFYGPPRTVTTIPYYQVLQSSDEGDPLNLKGKAVFVGFSEHFQPLQKDGFYTVFSDKQSGLDLSGVEIAATAFANLQQGRILSASESRIDMLVYFSWAILLGLVLRCLSAALLIPAVLVLGLAYHLLAYKLFQQLDYWIPLSIPLFWQAPLALIGTLLWNYFDEQSLRHNIRKAFGQHLPINVVDQLARGEKYNASSEKQIHGVILSTDAQQYTQLSEKLSPIDLRDLMNNYYVTLFSPVCNTGGVISDVVGDAALATWTSIKQSDLTQRRNACLAALEILSGVDEFNLQHPEHKLPTRMGLHYGELVMGHVGALNHYEYRAVGDTVNTASRIEGLNKLLGTRILVSSEMLQGLDSFISRDIGDFRLPGKNKALSLYELIGLNNPQHKFKPYNEFHIALFAFQKQQWQQAAANFENFILNYGFDGPSQYYLKLCRQYLLRPPADWDGITRIINK